MTEPVRDAASRAKQAGTIGPFAATAGRGERVA